MADDPETEKNPNSISELAKTLVYALLLAGVIRTVFFQPFWIPTGSMKDTLLVGDFLFVNKMAYGYSWASCPTIRGINFCGFAKDVDGRLFGGEPQRGDVIVFKHPSTQEDYIKRLIGLPGDRVQMKDGRLYINDEAVGVESNGLFTEISGPQGPVGGWPSCENDARELGDACTKSKSTETLPGGVKHDILNIASGLPGDDTAVFTVPAERYFFMGDNRDNSLDSRFRAPRGVGYVAIDNIVGRADRIVFSSAGRSILAFWTWRSDRYFKAIN